jgi:hypothetical protein
MNTKPYSFVCRESEKNYWDSPSHPSWDAGKYETKKMQYLACCRQVKVTMQMPSPALPQELIERYGSSDAVLDTLAAADRVSVQNGGLRKLMDSGADFAKCQAFVDTFSFVPGRAPVDPSVAAAEAVSKLVKKGDMSGLAALLAQAQAALNEAAQRSADAANMAVPPEGTFGE